jgi:hypothetical protein
LDSIASSSRVVVSHPKKTSKNWTKEENELLGEVIAKYGTDFHFYVMSNLFPKKTKNQIKVI